MKAAAACAVLALGAPALPAQETPAASTPPVGPHYSQLVSLSDAAELVLTARVLKQTVIPAERAPGLKAGFARLYLEAETLAVLAGRSTAPARFAYLADVETDSKGRAPKLKKREVVLFARSVPGRSGELQLVGLAGQLASDPQLLARLRPILASLAAADAPPRVTGVRDVLSSPGNLAGESETQVFLATANDSPAALTVIRRPGQAPSWGVSWTELVDQNARAPLPATLAWYRLACGLPRTLPSPANLSRQAEDLARARADYRFVLDQLGPCHRDAGGNPR